MLDTRPRTILSGDGEVEITLAGTVFRGDAIGYSAGWVQAQALYTAPIAALLFAAMDGLSGDKIKAYTDVVQWGYTTVTAGAPIYLSATPGLVTQIAPSVPYAVRQQLGVADKASAGAAYPVACALSARGQGGTMQVQRVAADNAAFYVQQWMALAGASAYALRVVERVVAGVRPRAPTGCTLPWLLAMALMLSAKDRRRDSPLNPRLLRPWGEPWPS